MTRKQAIEITTAALVKGAWPYKTHDLPDRDTAAVQLVMALEALGLLKVDE